MPGAPGQFFGYHLQLQRALFYLLGSGPDSSVSIEVTGDVAAALGNGVTTEEEDKSSLGSNPVTDRSLELWKTVYNWVKAVNDGSVDREQTRFILYTNHGGDIGIVNVLSEATDQDELIACVDQVKALFGSLRVDHPIYGYLEYILEYEIAFVSVVKAFEFIVGSKAGSEEIKKYLSGILLVSEDQVDYVHDELLGWLTNSVMSKIADKVPAIISWAEYSDRFKVLFQRVRARELIDFTMEYPADAEEVKEQIKSYPRYLKQLQIIDIEEHDQVSAVSDFLRRKVNADKWIESELIDEASAREFEEGLRNYWDSSRKMLGITEKSLKPEERGQVLFHRCKARQATIGSQPVLSHFVRGTYHNLANDDQIGWHESWKELLNELE